MTKSSLTPAQKLEAAVNKTTKSMNELIAVAEAGGVKAQELNKAFQFMRRSLDTVFKQAELARQSSNALNGQFSLSDPETEDPDEPLWDDEPVIFPTIFAAPADPEVPVPMFQAFMPTAKPAVQPQEEQPVQEVIAIKDKVTLRLRGPSVEAPLAQVITDAQSEVGFLDD